MKKWLSLLLLAALLLSGCGQKRNARVAICLRSCADTVAAERLEAVRTVFTEAGFAVAAADAEEDQSRQTRQIQDLIDENYDLLVVEPVMQEQAEEIAAMAQKARVPVIFIGYEPELESWEKACYVGTREDAAGAAQPQVLQSLPDKGDLNGDGVVTYAIIAGPEDDMDAIAHTEACRKALESGSCLETVHTDWSKDAAANACKKLLADYGKDMEVIFCNSDTLAMGAMAAVREGGRVVNETVYLVGLGGDFQARLLLRSGDLTGTVYLPAEELAQKILGAAETLLSGDPAQSSYGAYIPMTRDNVEDYIPQ